MKYKILLSVSVVSLLFISLPKTASALPSGLKKHPNQVYDVQIVNKVDQDGDGKLSNFDVKLRVGTKRFKFPSEELRALKKAVQEGIAKFTPIPSRLIGATTYKATLAPQYCISATDKHNTPMPLKDWWLPSNSNKSISKRFNVLSNDFIKVPQGQNSLGYRIKEGEIDHVDRLEIKTHYKPIKEKGLGSNLPAGKVTVKYPEGEEPKARGINHPCGVSGLIEKYNLNSGKGFDLEPPEQDKTGRVRFTSEVDGVEIYVNGDKIGKTPLVADLPVDIGKAVMWGKKYGYKLHKKKKKLNPTRNANQVINFEMERVKKPIVIKSRPPGASIYIGGGVTPFKTPHTIETWIKRTPKITVSKDGNSKTLESVQPPSTVEFFLDWGAGSNDKEEESKQEKTSTNIDPDMFQPTLSDSLYKNQISDLNYNTIVPPSLNLTPIAAKFTVVPTTTKTNTRIDFDASASYSLGEDLDSFNWDFKDGKSAKGEKVSHNYSDDGRYRVELTITDKNGKTTSTVKTITIKNRAPNPKFTASEYQLLVGEKVDFTANNSTDEDGSIQSYRWDLSDGNQAHGKKVSHSYNNSGNYQVKLTITDDDGASKTETKTITVIEKNKKPQAKIKVAQNKIGVNQQLKLDGRSSNDPDDSIGRYLWSIEDKILTGPTLTVKFSSTGTKNIQLFVEDLRKDSDKTSTSIEVVEEQVETKKLKTDGDKEKSEDKEKQSIFTIIINWVKSLLARIF